MARKSNTCKLCSICNEPVAHCEVCKATACSGDLAVFTRSIPVRGAVAVLVHVNYCASNRACERGAAFAAYAIVETLSARIQPEEEV